MPFCFKILGGFTGSGKTELLKSLEEKGEKVIDLEGIAQHKGSAFGNIGMPEQPSQEMFENILGNKLRDAGVGSAVWLEDESQRIGACGHCSEGVFPAGYPADFNFDHDHARKKEKVELCTYSTLSHFLNL